MKDIHIKKILKGVIIGMIIGAIIYILLTLFWPSSSQIAKKPIIYLYPTDNIEVNITLGNPGYLTHTYPKYDNGWVVLASPSGELLDLVTGRTYYALYWEGLTKRKLDFNEGFIIKGSNTIQFLEEKLEILGLNEREANEFIIYWLPELEINDYNFIRFQTTQEINKNMPLNINPKPDTIIRVMMEYKKIDKYINVKEQQLQKQSRTGFTVVEWGGIAY